MSAEQGRRASAALGRRGCFVEQLCPPQPSHEFSSAATADAEALCGGRAGDAWLGPYQRNELRRAEPADLGRRGPAVRWRSLLSHFRNHLS